MSALISLTWKDANGQTRAHSVYPHDLAGFVADLDRLGCTDIVIEAGHLLTPRIDIVYRGGVTLTTSGDKEVVCNLVWDGEVGSLHLDRRQGFGIALRDNSRNRRTARAYQQAVADGKFFERRRLTRDINGHWYVAMDHYPMGKYLASDLRKLGYLK
ncbi:MAG: hypothetical protein KJ077_10765 [Anaerolineae bacterium]|nr:hypothetical protein [Anaerolineae bacterium]